MSLTDKLLADMKVAMKDREAGKIRLATIRMVRAAQIEAEIAKKQELTDEEMLQIIHREVKKRREVIPDYEKAKRQDDIDRLNEEIKVLQEYLPEQLGENELRAIIARTIQEMDDSRDMGKIMKVIMPLLKGRADGKLINALVKEMLQ